MIIGCLKQNRFVKYVVVFVDRCVLRDLPFLKRWVTKLTKNHKGHEACDRSPQKPVRTFYQKNISCTFRERIDKQAFSDWCIEVVNDIWSIAL